MSTDDTKKVPDIGTLSAGGSSDSFDDSIDADFGDEEEESSSSFDDMGEDFPKEKKGGGKFMLPALALSVATIVGTVIIFGPQMLGKPSAQPDVQMSATETSPMPPVESAPLLPEPAPMPMDAVSTPPAPDVLPQPPVAINEAPLDSETPSVPVVSESLPQPEQAASMDVAPLVPTVTETTTPSVEPIVSEEPKAPAPAVEPVVEVVPPEIQPEAQKPEEAKVEPAQVAASSENKDMFNGVPPEAEVEINKAAGVNEAVTAPQATVAPPPVEDLPKVVDTIAAVPPDATTAPLIPDFEVKGDADAAVKPSAHETKIPDVYYDGINVPSGSMAKAVGPRKLDPTQEPASKFVIVEKTHNANDREAQVEAASRALKLGRYDAAVEMYQKLYDKNPRDPRIVMGLAVAQQNSGMVEQAIQSYQNFLDIKPNDTDATVNMLGLVRQQYPAVALRRLKELSDKYPSNAGIAAQIGITEGQEGNFDEALRYLGIAASMQPQNAAHLFNMAIIAEKKGDKAKAINYYEQALEVDAVYGGGTSVPRDKIYSRLSRLRG